MTDDETVREITGSVALAHCRILRVEGEERPGYSWLRVTCHLHREDLPWAAVPLIHALAALSFADARPRGTSEIDYQAQDDWEVGDTMQRLRFERGALALDADYVRGRMMKTTVTIEPQGRLVIRTRNRHEMALRWLGTLRGRKHIRLVVDRRDEPTRAPE